MNYISSETAFGVVTTLNFLIITLALGLTIMVVLCSALILHHPAVVSILALLYTLVNKVLVQPVILLSCFQLYALATRTPLAAYKQAPPPSAPASAQAWFLLIILLVSLVMSVGVSAGYLRYRNNHSLKNAAIWSCSSPNNSFFELMGKLCTSLIFVLDSQASGTRDRHRMKPSFIHAPLWPSHTS